jgi:hypothetical protein
VSYYELTSRIYLQMHRLSRPASVRDRAPTCPRCRRGRLAGSGGAWCGPRREVCAESRWKFAEDGADPAGPAAVDGVGSPRCCEGVVGVVVGGDGRCIVWVVQVVAADSAARYRSISIADGW